MLKKRAHYGVLEVNGRKYYALEQVYLDEAVLDEIKTPLDVVLDPIPSKPPPIIPAMSSPVPIEPNQTSDQLVAPSPVIVENKPPTKPKYMKKL
jgi:hypothetical protein